MEAKRAVEFFDAKIQDAMLLGDIKRAVASNTEVILFNIDSKAANRAGRDAILAVFLKVLNEWQGYSGDHPHIAHMERYLEGKAKLRDFQDAYRTMAGAQWTEERDAYEFNRDEVIKALALTLSQSEQSCEKWIDGAEDKFALTIENFCKWVKDYLDAQGADRRIVFLVDEVGQFIGSDAHLMLNLQTITEELGTVCKGRAWVVVTSQEDIDAVLGEIQGTRANDFSKIQGRFRTRLSLSSANVDEVIQERLLAKRGDVRSGLEAEYAKQADILKNQLSFKDLGTTLPGFRDADDFVRNYPFAPYQFKLLQKIFESIRKAGATGLHLAQGERSLLDAFQHAGQSYHRAECLTHVGDSQAVRSLTQCGEPKRFAMAAPIDLRNDFDTVSLRRLAKRTRDATQSRRLLALAEVYDGGSRTDASRIGGVGLQIIRDWVLRFNARGPDGLVDGKSPGAPSKLNADHRRALAEVVEAGPVPAVDGVVRWRRKDLARWLLETFAISLDETTVGRELKALGFAKISARPRHYAQNELAVEAFKKNFPAELAKIRARLPKGVEIELWWQDEARIGQKNKLTRRWARRGTRPRAPRDQRTEWAYIFGAICPAKGKGAGLVMPWCDTDAMAAHLIEISAAVDPGAHAVLIVDQAGWHLTPKLAIPDNITVLALPPRSPELNPVENVWQFMRDNWLSNRIFKSYEDIVALCCQAWNNLIDQPWKIMSLGMRKWPHGF